METLKNRILVPVDFSEVSDFAIQHAVIFAKKINADLYLLHIIEKPLIYVSRNNKYDNQLIEEATMTRLQKIADEIEYNQQLNVEIIAISGNIFDSINHVAREMEANFVFMGTHGVKGMQYIRGSNALRILYQATIPYILTQKLPQHEGEFDNIIFPVDVQPESAQKADWAIFIAKKFNSKINIIVPKENDKLINRKVNWSLNFVKKAFTTAGINFNVKLTDRDNTYLAEDTIKFAEEIKANLIMVMIYPSKGTEFLITPDQQKVISNPHQIPVMCINLGTLVTLQQNLV